MKSGILVALIAVVGFVSAETYTDRYDYINVDQILANKRLLVPYVKCVLGEGKCTAEGQEIRANIKDAMENGCKKCTDKQKTAARKVVNYLKKDEPEYYKQIVAKYDPENKYKPTYEAFLAAED